MFVFADGIVDHILSTPRNEREFDFTTSVVIGTDCIGSCKSNYHSITATTAAIYNLVFILLPNYVHVAVFCLYVFLVDLPNLFLTITSYEIINMSALGVSMAFCKIIKYIHVTI